MEEDCLFLNVYTPTTDSGQAQKFPVMFYIHDGQFEHGSGNDFPGKFKHPFLSYRSRSNYSRSRLQAALE